MYVPKRYEENNVEELDAFIRTYGFAVLISYADNQPVATHVPLQLHKTADGQKFLYGHFAKANPQWKSFELQKSVLAIFSGPHAYITPRWYDHMNVPTWNYAAVHVYGSPIVVSDEKEVRIMLAELVRQYEPDGKYTVDSLSKEYYDDHVKAIVGFKIKIERMEAAFKLSQNRHEKDYRNIIDQLQKTDDNQAVGIAKLMEQKNPHAKK